MAAISMPLSQVYRFGALRRVAAAHSMSSRGGKDSSFPVKSRGTMEITRFSAYTHIEVEPNENTPMMATQVYKNLDVPFPVSHVRIYEGEPEGKLCAITGWSSAGGGSDVQAYAVRVEDSSEGSAFVVYGGDWGVRLRPAESDEPWSIDSAGQWGETHLVLSDVTDITRR
jgi:hypothetical protein